MTKLTGSLAHDATTNNPPEDTPFEAVRVHIEDISVEARHWLDGSVVTSQAEADAVGKLLDMARQAEKAADDARKLENEPYDKAKAEVQARYAPLIGNTKAVKGKTVLIAEACKAALAPWLRKQDDERRAEAQRLAAEAAERQREAAEAMRAAQANDLQAREAAEALVTEAKAAETAATKAANDRAHAAGGARATHLRTYWRVEIADARELCRHYWTTRPDYMAAAALALAEQDVREGKRAIPGANVIEDRRVA